MSDKMGPKEAQLQAMREARLAKNKKLIDSRLQVKATAIGSKVAVRAKTRDGARKR